MYFNSSSTVVVTGKLGADPNINEEKGFAKVSIGVIDYYRDKATNEWKSNAHWIDVTMWGKMVNAAKKMKKGDLIQVVGHLKTNIWDKKKMLTINPTEVINFAGKETSNSKKGNGADESTPEPHNEKEAFPDQYEDSDPF